MMPELAMELVDSFTVHLNTFYVFEYQCNSVNTQTTIYKNKYWQI